MKLIVAGATGFVASEVIRQGLKRAEITSVIALARKEMLPPSDDSSNAGKLKSVVIQDYGVYPAEAKKELAGANACIWTVAITPSKSLSADWNDVKYVCQDCTLAGLTAFSDAGVEKPFRFVYMSGAVAQRDQTKTPELLPGLPERLTDYCLMRGRVESQVLGFAAEHEDFEAEIVRPGLITRPEQETKNPNGYPTIAVSEVAASMLDQAIGGFEKETLDNLDMTRIGQRALGK